jgi:hypothetical protein
MGKQKIKVLKEIDHFCAIKKELIGEKCRHGFSCSALCSVLFLGSAWGPCHWSLLLGRVRVAFIERRLFLFILLIIFDCFCS